MPCTCVNEVNVICDCCIKNNVCIVIIIIIIIIILIIIIYIISLSHMMRSSRGQVTQVTLMR